jgi:hypothetical protein
VKTHTLETAEAAIVYDVEGPLPTADGRPPLFMIGQPMDASGFRTLASYVTVLVAHEPPLVPVLADAEAADRAMRQFRDAYAAEGQGFGMAAFIAMTSWQGEFTEEYFAQATPDPAQFGMPSEDDGSRDNPLLSDRSTAVTSYRPDFDALAATPTRIMGRRVRGDLHRTHVGCHSRTPRTAGDGLPESSRGLRGRRFWICGPASSLRSQAARGANRGRLTLRWSEPTRAGVAGHSFLRIGRCGWPTIATSMCTPAHFWIRCTRTHGRAGRRYGRAHQRRGEATV